MIPNAKGLIYSYKDFTEQDLKPQFFDPDDVFTKDTISFLDLDPQELDKFITKNFVGYCKDLNTEHRYHSKYFFKEFCVRFFDENDDIRTENQVIFRYSLAGWNPYSKRKGIDDRTLTVEILRFIPRVETTYSICQFIVKTEHIYQLIKDLRGVSTYIDAELLEKESRHDEIANDQLVNLYILPIYVLDHDKYQRISDFAYGELNFEELLDLIVGIRHALKVFACTNFYMLNIYNNNEKVLVYNKETRRFSNMTFKAYSSVATSDKKVYVYTEPEKPNSYSSSIEINIDADSPNILAGTDIPRKLCDYRYSVRGYWSHRWVGKGANKKLQKVWIDPYEKNKDKPFKIIKETRLR